MTRGSALAGLTDAAVANALGAVVFHRTTEELAVVLELENGVRVVVTDLTGLGDPEETYALLRSTHAATGHARAADIAGGEGFLADGPLRGAVDCTVLAQERVHTVSVVGGDDPAGAAVTLAGALLNL
ncbi:hypothetical protein [Mariniluteicoccus flavus]